MSEDAEAKKRLEEFRRETAARLRAGLDRVERLEPLVPGGAGEIEKRIADEYASRNSTRPDFNE